MRRRGVGVGAVHDMKTGQGKFKEKSSVMQENLVEELSKNIDQFKERLEAFAAKHSNSIKKDAEFREHFQEMCASIGVDPLASSKGFWSEMLGMGTFYFEIAVQAVEVVLSRAHINGGVMTLGELHKRLVKTRSHKQAEISSSDILRAFGTLNILGKSCGVIESGTKKEDYLIFCVPEELSLDVTTVIQHTSESGSPFFTRHSLEKGLGWSHPRVQSVIERLICEGIVWVDIHQGHSCYWFPSLFLAGAASHPTSDDSFTD